ncbi:MAG: hypothetical protein ACI9W2_002503 [Gammaproteobacteria bacterium]|jgi:hypothetical protein
MTLATEPDALKDLKVDKENLYLEETFSDLRVGSVRRLTPVTPMGDPDAARPVLYFGHAQVMSQMGALPVQFEMEAESLEDALDKFSEGAQEAVMRMVEEIKEMQRQQASQIVVPGSGGGGGGMPPMNPGGRFSLR